MFALAVDFSRLFLSAFFFKCCNNCFIWAFDNQWDILQDALNNFFSFVSSISVHYILNYSDRFCVKVSVYVHACINICVCMSVWEFDQRNCKVCEIKFKYLCFITLLILSKWCIRCEFLLILGLNSLSRDHQFCMDFHCHKQLLLLWG